MKIKFKIWDKKLNKFISWNSIPTHDFESEEYNYCQFSGLTDKNEKEIYEGDILEENKEIGVCKSILGGWRVFSVKPSVCFSSYNAKIIGNIYENPELLK